MANPKQRSTSPLNPLPYGRTRQAGLVCTASDLTMMSRETTIGLEKIPDPLLTQDLADAGIPMCVAPQHNPQGILQCKAEESDAPNPFPQAAQDQRQSTTTQRQSSGDCGVVGGKWLTVPHPTIDHAEFQGSGVYGVDIYYQFYIEGRLVGSLECRDDCQQVVTQREYDFNLTFTIRHWIGTMVMPARVAKILRLIKLARLLGKGAKLAKMLWDDREIVEYVLKQLGPAIKVLEDSADLICKGRFDPKQLRDALPKYLPQGAMIA